MVDVLTARFQNRLGDLINRDGGRSVSEGPTELFGAQNLPLIARLARDKHRQEQIKKRELTKQISTKLLLSIKEKDWGVFLATRNRPNSGLSCSACTPDSKSSFNSEDDNSLMLQDVLKMRDPPKDCGWFAYYFNHLYALCSSTHHDYPNVSNTVLNDDRVKKAVELSAEQLLEEADEEADDKYLEKLVKINAERAARILQGMQTKVNNLVFKIVGWFTYKVLLRAFSGVAIHPSQIKMLEAAKARGLPIIYLPLHRSHLDYVTVALILQCIDFRAPLVASGDNLKVPILEWALKNTGAFFIKRRIDPVEGRKDVLYRAILYTYMAESLKAGYHIEFFIEGGRTRTGKPIIPKGGLLSIVVDAYINGMIEDALLVPISINYDRLVDGNFTREQLGEPKQPETLWGTLSAIYTTVTSYYGMMRVNFNQPFSLKELVKSFEKQRSSSKSLHVLPASSSFHGTGVVSEDHRQLVNSVATHIVYDCCQYMPVMSTNAISFLLLTKFRNGVTIEELGKEMDKLRQRLEWDHRDVGFTGTSIHIIKHAIRLLGPSLVEQNGSDDCTSTFVKPVLELQSIIELSYYSNTLVPHFIMPAVVVTALYSLYKDEFATSQNRPENSSKPTVTQLDLLRHSLKLCDILQYEFIFTKPCQYLDTVIIQAMEHLATLDILAEKQELLMEEEQWSHRFAKTLQEEEDDFDNYSTNEWENDRDDDSDDCRLNSYNDRQNNVTYEINLDAESLQHLLFYRNIAAPFVESYSTSAKCLELLVGTQNQEQAHVMAVLGQIKTQLSQGILKFNECAAVDQIRNSLKLFEKWLILECFTQDKIKLLYLNEDYDSKSGLEPIIERISCFR